MKGSLGLRVSRFTVTQAALSNISVIVTDTEIQSVLIYDYVALYLKENIIEGALLTMFFGLFTVLAGVAVYVLFLKGIKQRANTAMFIAMTVLWLSTTTYWIVTLVATANIYSTLLDQVSRNMDRIARLDDCVSSLQAQGTTNTAVLCSSEGPATFPLGLGTTNRPEVYQLQDCTGTAALTVNVIVADLIVWWRALVLWPNHRVVRLVCVVMITLALVTGALDTRDACVRRSAETGWYFIPSNTYVPAPSLSGHSLGGFVPTPNTNQLGPGWLSGSSSGTAFSGDVLGVVAGCVSLLTNVTATSLIAYRAWKHRRAIMSYLKGSLPSSRTQVERTLALLVKSGFVYCVLLVFVVVYECSFLSSPPMAPAFTTGFYYVMNGCLVPLIGMYPTMIIIACAAEKSMNEKCAEEHVQNGSIVLNWPQAGSHRDASEAVLSELVNESDSTVHAGVRLMSDAGHFTDLESQDETNSVGRAAPHSAV